MRGSAALRIAATVTIAAAVLAAAPDGVRDPVVAGRFYPDDPVKLRAAVQGFLDDAMPFREERPWGLVLPHAGYVFSGQIAADGWRQVRRADVDLVVILGTNHTVAPFDGVAVFPGSGFRTPLGIAAVDEAAAKELAASDPAFVLDAGPHRTEHSIEVQVPFAQVALPGAKILPAVVGRPDPEMCSRLGRALAKLAASRKVLLVASSDLSHYPDYDDAVETDAATLKAVASIDPSKFRASIASEMGRGRPNLGTCACGEAPVLALLEAVRALGPAHASVLSYANSGDGPLADRDRVVGYGAVTLAAGARPPDVAALQRVPPPPASTTLTAEDGRTLLRLARESIRRWLAADSAPLARNLPPTLLRKQGAFVTLREHGDLRGCIGHTAEDLPLGQVVGMMALNAAFEDSRFSPVAAKELPEIKIEVSVLTPLVRVPGPEAIRLGKDGAVLRKDGRGALFLPEVATEQGWTRDEMLGHLCVKAGLASDCWRRGAEFATFQTVVFREQETLGDRKN